METKHALVIMAPGEKKAPLEKAYGKDHPAKVSKVSAKIDTNNPPASHRDRIAFAKMAAKRMLESGASKPEDEGDHQPSTVDHKGREKGGKAPYSGYSTSVSGEGSRATDLYGKRTYVVKPSELAAGTPESASAHQPKKVRKPKK